MLLKRPATPETQWQVIIGCLAWRILLLHCPAQPVMGCSGQWRKQRQCPATVSGAHVSASSSALHSHRVVKCPPTLTYFGCQSSFGLKPICCLLTVKFLHLKFLCISSLCFLIQLVRSSNIITVVQLMFFIFLIKCGNSYLLLCWQFFAGCASLQVSQVGAYGKMFVNICGWKLSIQGEEGIKLGEGRISNSFLPLALWDNLSL